MPVRSGCTSTLGIHELDRKALPATNSLNPVGANNGGAQNDVEIVADRMQRAKQFHKKLHDLLRNPLIDHFL